MSKRRLMPHQVKSIARILRELHLDDDWVRANVDKLVEAVMPGTPGPKPGSKQRKRRPWGKGTPEQRLAARRIRRKLRPYSREHEKITVIKNDPIWKATPEPDRKELITVLLYLFRHPERLPRLPAPPRR